MCVNEANILRMKELIEILKEADVAYYRDDNPTMTDLEYDLLTDELLKLEAKTGQVLSGSPTQKVSGEILEELTPVRHTKPMLSAKKTKSIEDLVRFADHRPVLVSWKLDGLTIVLRYENGALKQAITRGREGIGAVHCLPEGRTRYAALGSGCGQIFAAAPGLWRQIGNPYCSGVVEWI